MACHVYSLHGQTSGTGTIVSGAKAGSRKAGLQGSWAAGFQGACTPREMQVASLHSSRADAPQPTVLTCTGLGKPGDALYTCLHTAARPSPAIWTCSCKSRAVSTEAISLQSPGLPAPAPAPPFCQHCICPWLASLGPQRLSSPGALCLHTSSAEVCHSHGDNLL